MAAPAAVRVGRAVAMNSEPKVRTNECGFSLIEIVLAVGIIGSVAIFAITMLGTQMSNRNDLNIVNESNHVLHAAMTRIYDDLRHAYMPDKKDAIFANVSRRRVKPGIFQRSDSLIFTIQSFESMVRDSGESNLAVVKYATRKAPDNPSATQLIRTTDTNMMESIEGSLVGTSLVLVPDLKDFKVTWWDGQDFTPDWNSDQGATRGLIPKMAKIELAIYRMPGESEKAALARGELTEEKRSVLSVEAIVYLLYSRGFEQVKTKSSEYSWR